MLIDGKNNYPGRLWGYIVFIDLQSGEVYM